MGESVLIPYILLVFILLLDLHGVHAIKCYECQGSQEGCGDPFNDKAFTTKECQYADSCVKDKGTDKTGNTVLSRMCSAMHMSGNICKEWDAEGTKGLTCLCKTDGCNPATSVHSAWLSGPLIFGLILTFMLLK